MASGGSLIAGGIACWFFPLFHIRPLGEEAAEAGGPSSTPHRSGSADPAAYVRDLWDGPLRTGDDATEITQLWDAFDVDADIARSQYGRQVGLGGAWFFCVRGQGAVEKIERNRSILTAHNHSRLVSLELGLVVGNTVREALGVNVSDFANSQDFNAVSSELNRRVEEEVIAPNRPLMEPGAIVDFVGCARIGGESDLAPLYLIPIRLDVRGNE